MTGLKTKKMKIPTVRIFKFFINIDNVDGCENYTEEASCPQEKAVIENFCGGNLAMGCYRFQEAAKEWILKKCYCSCLDGSHSTVAKGVVTRYVCCGWGPWTNCCINIEVKNCNSYYLYKLHKPSLDASGCLWYCGNTASGTFP